MTISPDLRTLTEDILARAVEDWVTPSDVISACIRADVRDPEDARDLAIGLITRLIATGLLVPGDIQDGVHRPWSCSSAEAIVRITKAWSSFDDPIMVMPGEIVWLDTSPDGERIGTGVLARESA